MKKVIGIILIGTFLFLSQSCSSDEEAFEENTKLTEEFNGKMGSSTGNSGPLIEGCEIIYTFYDSNLTPMQKNAIRNSYGPGVILSYETLNSSQEKWYTDCYGINNYIDEFLRNNPNHDPDEPICEPLKGCLDKCQSGTCSSSGGSGPVDDPFGNNDY